MKPYRLAFLTPEYVTTRNNQGGLASYMRNIAGTLAGMGHDVHVLVSSDVHQTLRHEGITVHHVSPADNTITKTLWRLAQGHWRISDLYRGTLGHLRRAAGLAHALEMLHQRQPFDMVQSSEFGLAGLFVKRQQSYRHLVRCSSTGDLLINISMQNPCMDARLLMRLERQCIRRADVAYAPSRFTAEHYIRQFGLKVQVLQPPLMPLGARNLSLHHTSQKKSSELPARYLLFFGKLGRIKGTDVLAQALKLAWREEPELTMVWAGAQAQEGFWQHCCDIMGKSSQRVHWLGAVDRSLLLSIIHGAMASVLPSRCDNLPNTMLESLSLGVPVIGSKAGGFDEVIQPGFNGELVAPEDPQALAEALVRAWRGQWSSQRGKDLRTPAMLDMEPKRAASNLLHLAGLISDQCVAGDTTLRQAA